MMISSEKFRFEVVWASARYPTLTFIWLINRTITIFIVRICRHTLGYFDSANWTLADSALITEHNDPFSAQRLVPRTETKHKSIRECTLTLIWVVYFVFTKNAKILPSLVPILLTDTIRRMNGVQNGFLEEPKSLGCNRNVVWRIDWSPTDFILCSSNLALSLSHLQIRVSLTHQLFAAFYVCRVPRACVCVCVHWDNLCVRNWLARVSSIVFWFIELPRFTYCILRIERADSSTL